MKNIVHGFLLFIIHENAAIIALQEATPVELHFLLNQLIVWGVTTKHKKHKHTY